MKRIIICAITLTIFLGCEQTNPEKKNEPENKVQKITKQKVENWANFDDECDQKSEANVDTILFRKTINKILSAEKVLEYYGTGYHNFYLGLTTTKEGETDFTLSPDISYWLSPGNCIEDTPSQVKILHNRDNDEPSQIREGDGNQPSIKIRSDENNRAKRSNRNNVQKIKASGQIFYAKFADDSKIFKVKPGIMNGRSVRTIKLYEISIHIGKDSRIVKPWTIRELEMTKFRDHLLEENVDKYWYSTGLAAVSVDGFEEIRNSIVYPEEALKNGITGRVVVEIYADVEGNYAGYQLIKGLGYGCDEAVIRAIEKVKFRTYPMGQRSSIIVPFEFGTRKTALIDLAVQLFDYSDKSDIYNNMRLGIVNKYALEKNIDKDYFVYVYVDNKLVFRSLCRGISKSEAQQFFWFRWRPEKSGTYEYKIFLDPENRLNETIRANNVVRGSLKVRV